MAVARAGLSGACFGECHKTKQTPTPTHTCLMFNTPAKVSDLPQPHQAAVDPQPEAQQHQPAARHHTHLRGGGVVLCCVCVGGGADSVRREGGQLRVGMCMADTHIERDIGPPS